MKRSSAVLALAAASALALGGPAAAESPMSLQDQVTDTADVLSAAEEQQVQDAFDEVQDETGQMVFVAFVDSFDGMSAEQWSVDTAEQSNLGVDNVLLSVAVEDGAYGYGLNQDSTISDAEIQAILRDDVVPQLSNDSWAEAAIAFAQGVGAEADSNDSAGGGGGGFGAFLLIAVIAIIAVVAIAVWAARRKKKGGDTEQRRDGRRLPPDHPLNLPTEQLANRAGAALVAADDEMRSSEQELAFAKAQFGLQATDAFSAALDQAKEKVGAAFTIRQRLDDAQPETEPEQRQMYAEILRLTSEADEAVQNQTKQFHRLRDMQARAPQVLDELEQRTGEVERQIEGARAELARLATQYRAAALASVSQNPEQARALLTSARTAVAEGRAKVGANDRAGAVTHARIAEQAIAQAATLLANVREAGDVLRDADDRLDVALASITSDVQDANRLARQDPVVVARRKEAEAAIAQGHQARVGGDPLAALRRLESAETAIDKALAPLRAQDENNRRAAAQLHDRLGRLGSQLRAVSDYIDTRRGVVGPEARTRLSEATRLAAEANQLAGQDPVAAMHKVAQAEQLAQSAQQLAERDVNSNDPWGGGGGGWGRPRRGGIDVGSLILGGILSGGFGGGHHGGWGGGFGGGGGGGGFGGGGGGFGGGGFGGGGGRF